MKKLIVKEFVISSDIMAKKYGQDYEIGEQYSVFQDPKTGKFYRPKDGFTVIGEDLSDRFIEITPKP